MFHTFVEIIIAQTTIHQLLLAGRELFVFTLCRHHFYFEFNVHRKFHILKNIYYQHIIQTQNCLQLH